MHVFNNFIIALIFALQTAALHLKPPKNLQIWGSAWLGMPNTKLTAAENDWQQAEVATVAESESGAQPPINKLSQEVIVLALIVLLAAIVWWSWPRRPSVVNRGTQTQTSTRSVSSQSPTTYTALRGSAQPRFTPLPDHSHG